ncbi:MAG: hypothetical protein LBU34_13900 [Planctomycetaceae bacterium]|jgi:hypothetical protein|nr:hypothetical protein [Planctomycetaceae bacterium]
MSQIKTKKKTGHGGFRVGAGRKAGEPRIKLSFRIRETIARQLEQLAVEKNKTKTEIVELAIENFKEKKKKIPLSL